MWGLFGFEGTLFVLVLQRHQKESHKLEDPAILRNTDVARIWTNGMTLHRKTGCGFSSPIVLGVDSNHYFQTSFF